jgi:HSP20 family molecular chaperone IbpA
MKNELATRSSNRLFPSLLDTFDVFYDYPFFGSFESKFLTGWQKTEGGYKWEVNIPKYKREDVSVNVEGGMLVVEGKKKDAPFFMEISIPSYADSNSLKAKLEDGVLTVSANQLESAKAKEIEIE